jgi:hypothetical protein
MGSNAGVALTVLSCTVGVLGAQQFVAMGREAMPRDAGQTARTLLVDLDGDGAFDVYALGTNVLTPWYRNDGRGRFARSTFAVPYGADAAVTGDLDGDGDRDVHAGYVVENRGAAGPAVVMPAVGYGAPLAAGDFDGDGRDDVVFAGGARRSLSLTTYGPASGAPNGTFASGPLTGVAVGDLDGDGDLDLVWSASSGSIAMPPPFPPLTWPGFETAALNDGTGTFTNVGTSLFPGTPDDVTSGMVVLDLDGDGDTDVGFLSSSGAVSTWRFWRNQAAGTFAPWGVVPFAPVPLTVFDLDRDGDADLVADTLWYENLGAAQFAARSLPAPGSQLRAVGDVDGDLDVDLVYGGYHPSARTERLLLNQGGQTFVDATALPLANAPHPSAIPLSIHGDVDGDGFPEVLDCGGPLWRNRGDGWLEPTPFPWGATLARAMQLADVDGDVDGDVLFEDGPTSAGSSWAAIQTAGAFAVVPLPLAPPSSGTNLLAVFDADGDGDVDLLRSQGNQFAIVRNDGALQFTVLAASPWPTTSPQVAVARDLDGDNDLDLLVGFSGPGACVHRFFNDGTGAFTHDPAGVVVGTGYVGALHVADIDGDQDLDAVVGCVSGTGPNRHRLLRNVAGVLTADPAALPAIDAWGFTTIGDVDLDGDVDVVAMQWNAVSSLHLAFWRNDGTGTFQVAGDFGPVGDFVMHELVDVDRDGDADLLSAGRLLTNRQWHCEAPFLAQTGTTYTLRFGGRALPNALALPWFGSRLQPALPLPGLGTLALDPATAVPLAPLLLVGEVGETSFAIPPLPALVGMPFSLQTVLLGAAGELHLTPPKHELVRS